MVRLNYNPMGMDQVMAILQQATGPGGQPEILATHPDPANRRVNIAKEIKSTYKATQNNPQYVFNESQYQAGMLTPLKSVPAPKRSQLDTEPSTPRAFALGRPETWCAHCAAAAAAAAATEPSTSESGQTLTLR